VLWGTPPGVSLLWSEEVRAFHKDFVTPDEELAKTILRRKEEVVGCLELLQTRTPPGRRHSLDQQRLVRQNFREVLRKKCFLKSGRPLAQSQQVIDDH
jgi:hypothetical protein